MAQFKEAWLEHQRQHWMRPNAHLWMRPDAYRFLPPSASDGHKDQPHGPIESHGAAGNFETEVQQLRCEIASLRFTWELQKFAAKGRKANFNPEQPRDEIGRWTDAGGATLGDPPDIPDEMPETAQLRNRIIKEAAFWLAKAAAREAVNPLVGTFLNVLDAALWIQDGYPYIRAYLDQPKSLDELQQAALAPQKGYDRHHIVEKTPAAQDGFPTTLINAPENLVLIPTLKHWEINSWYERPNKNYGGVTPRVYVRDKSWEERRAVGLSALIKSGVLKP